MQPFWSIANIPLLYLFCVCVSLFLFSFLSMCYSTLYDVLSFNMATPGSWGALGRLEWHSLPPSALFCPGMSPLTRFPQPLQAVPLDGKNSVSELFSHLSPTYSLSSFLFQCTFILPMPTLPQEAEKLSLFTAIYCFLFLLCSCLNSFSTHTTERSILIFL